MTRSNFYIAKSPVDLQTFINICCLVAQNHGDLFSDVREEQDFLRIQSRLIVVTDFYDSVEEI